ncbi:MAG: class I SAM-dependent methyltransferase, partial [Myxococcota bacterium]
MTGNAKLALTAEAVATLRAQGNQEYYHHIETFRGKMLVAVAKRIMPRVLTERLELSGAIQDTIETYKPEQILELAGGASMYGVGWSVKNPEKVYVEVDLPHIVEWKREKVSEIKSKEGLPQTSNYHIETLDLIQADLLDKVGSYFDSSKKTLVIAEGLDMYFNSDQHDAFVGNLSRFLGIFDEVSFVTHDFNVDAPLNAST